MVLLGCVRLAPPRLEPDPTVRDVGGNGPAAGTAQEAPRLGLTEPQACPKQCPGEGQVPRQAQRAPIGPAEDPIAECLGQCLGPSGSSIR